MKTVDIIQETNTALSANKARTALTMLGIIIGISSVITMIAIGNGAQASIESNIQSLGSNLVMITPGAQRSFTGGPSTGRGTSRTLTQADANAISGLGREIQAVAPELSARYQVVAKGTNTNTSVVGVTGAYSSVRNVTVAEGDFISDGSNAKVAVLGPTVASDLFPEGEDPLGQNIRINGQIFSVIGVTVAKGGSGFGSQDDMIFIPLTTAQRYLAGEEYVTTISVQAADADAMSDIQAEITALLLSRHRISDPAAADFSILNQNDIIATASTITSTFTLLLGAVAGISLLVGGIGIMNMMLTTVTERTREIGLRKAIGATRSDISTQFLVEAVALTVIGGAVGVALGWGVAWLITILGVIQTKVSLSSVLLAFGVSAVIGIVFGYYPARRASKLRPIEALRYE
jgi:putative ABC transport system permease protein